MAESRFEPLHLCRGVTVSHRLRRCTWQHRRGVGAYRSCSKDPQGPLDLVLARALSLPLCGWFQLDSGLSSLSITQSHSGHINGHCLECSSVVLASWGVDDHFNTHLLAVTLFTANAASGLSGKPHWGHSSPAFWNGYLGNPNRSL